MEFTYPHKIDNGMGEELIFKALQKEPDGDRLLVENYVTPGQGPLMHTHWLQDECLTVVKGKIGYQVKGQPAQYASEGESVLFERGTPHRFWNAGERRTSQMVFIGKDLDEGRIRAEFAACLAEAG